MIYRLPTFPKALSLITDDVRDKNKTGTILLFKLLLKQLISETVLVLIPCLISNWVLIANDPA
jgi:hypothetical protein